MTPFIIWKSLITDSRLRVCQSIRSVIYCSSIDPGGDVNLPFLQCLSLFMFSVAEILMKKQGRQKRNIARQVAIFGCQRLGLHKQKYIAEYFSLSHRGSVSSAINAIEGSIESGDLKNRFNQIRRGLNFTKRT